MNRVYITGRIIREPTVQEQDDNDVLCTFFIASDAHAGADGKKNCMFRVTARGTRGRIIARYAVIGSEIIISGRLEQGRYRDENGDTVVGQSIAVDQFKFMGRFAEIKKPATYRVLAIGPLSRGKDGSHAPVKRKYMFRHASNAEH